MNRRILLKNGIFIKFIKFNYFNKLLNKNKIKELNSVEDAEKYVLEKEKARNIWSKASLDEKLKKLGSKFEFDYNKSLCSYTFNDTNKRYSVEVNFPTTKEEEDEDPNDKDEDDEKSDEILETDLLVFITVSRLKSIDKFKEDSDLNNLLNMDKNKLQEDNINDKLFLKGYIKGRKLEIETYNILDNPEKISYYKNQKFKSINSKDLFTNSLSVLDIEVQNRFMQFLHELGLNYDTIDLIVRLSDYYEQEQIKNWYNKIKILL